MHEQPKAVADTLLDRLLPDGTLALDEVHITNDEFRAVNKVFIVACGSSYHAGLMAKYAIEHWARLPVEIDIASEFRYRDPVLDARTLVIGVSQSGETVDTLQAIRRPGGWGQGAGHLQRGRLVDGPRGRRRPLHPGRPGDRGGRHQDPPGPDHRPRDPGPLPGPGPGDAVARPRPVALFGAMGGPSRQGGDGPGPGVRRGGGGPALPRLALLHLPRAPGRLPGGPGGRPQAEGALLPAGRGVPRRRAQARAHRPGRAGHGGDRRGHPHAGCGRR